MFNVAPSYFSLLVAGAGFEGDGGGEVDNLISKAYTQAPIHEAEPLTRLRWVVPFLGLG